MLGVIPTSEAMRTAMDAGLDLVEVAPNERPPVCRIMDYGKFKYEQKRKAANSAKQHQVQLKEIRLRPKTGEHDIDFTVGGLEGGIDRRIDGIVGFFFVADDRMKSHGSRLLICRHCRSERADGQDVVSRPSEIAGHGAAPSIRSGQSAVTRTASGRRDQKPHPRRRRRAHVAARG